MNRQFGAFTGLAMMLIVLNHALSLGIDAQAGAGFPQISGWEQTLLSILQALGIFAVPVFLFISGSFVSYAAQGNPPRLSSKFLLASLKHIVVPYLIWSAIFYIEIQFLHGESYDAFGYVKNLLVGYPYHFIPLLLVFYILSPVLVVIGKKYGLLLIIVIGLYQLFTMNVIKPGSLGVIFPSWMHILALPILRNTLADWAIYFPLGLVYGLHSKTMLPWLKRWFFWLLIATLFFFFIGMLDANRIIQFPVARFICQTTFVLAIPAITRDRIPIVRQLEKIGKRSYGLYLSHLIVIDMSLLVLQNTVQWLIGIHVLLFPVLFLLGLLIPLGIMEIASRSPIKAGYRYVFG
jgi:hypothetical protein